MLALMIVVVCTAIGIAILVAYSRHLFKENRTRIVRREPRRPLLPVEVEPGAWRTLVPRPVVTGRR